MKERKPVLNGTNRKPTPIKAIPKKPRLIDFFRRFSLFIAIVWILALHPEQRNFPGQL